MSGRQASRRAGGETGRRGDGQAPNFHGVQEHVVLEAALGRQQAGVHRRRARHKLGCVVADDPLRRQGGNGGGPSMAANESAELLKAAEASRAAALGLSATPPPPVAAPRACAHL